MIRHALVVSLLLGSTGCAAVIPAAVIGGMANGIQFTHDFLDLDVSWNNFLGEKKKQSFACRPVEQGNGVICTEQ